MKYKLVGHDQNKELLPGIWIAHKQKSAFQMFPFQIIVSQIPTAVFLHTKYSGDPNYGLVWYSDHTYANPVIRVPRYLR